MTVLPLILAGCQFHTSGYEWTDQRVADGPCYDANLLDGLDEESTSELHAVFACLDQTGAIEAFSPLDAAMDGSTRQGTAGVVLARWVNGLDGADLSLTGAVDGALALLDNREGIHAGVRLAVELLYAAPWADVGVAIPLAEPASLDAGVIAPLLRLAGPIATVLLDDELRELAPIATFLRSDALVQLAWTAASVAESTDPTLSALAHDWPANVADLLSRAENTTNNRSFGATGNSIRDIVSAGVAQSTRAAFSAPIAEILDDPTARDGVSDALRSEIAHGRLATVPAQALYLASVDVNGGSLAGGEDSALVSLVRLLHDTNEPVDCSIDLGITSVDVSFGNLAVAILEAIATTDPDSTESGVSLLGDMLGVPLTDAILQGVAETGVCPTVTEQVVNDLHAIDRLNDPATANLLRVLLSLLNALQDHVPAVADAATAAHGLNLVTPAEEALRDIADAPFVAGLIALVPVLLDPEVYHDAEFPVGVRPVSFDDVWMYAQTVLTDGSLDTLDPLVSVIVLDGDLWLAVTNVGRLLAEPDVELAGALELVADAVLTDPLLGAADDLAARLDEPSWLVPALVLVEPDAVRAALLTTSPTAEGALPFIARLARGDTFDVVIDTLALLRDLLPEDL